jgi:hypothetical protein
MSMKRAMTWHAARVAKRFYSGDSLDISLIRL